MKKQKVKDDKNTTMQMSLFYKLPDEIFLHLLHYCETDEIENTRAWQSKVVQHCTETRDMIQAVKNGNLDNIKWIKERMDNNASQVGIVREGGGVAAESREDSDRWEDVFTTAAKHGYFDIMKWLKQVGCSWGSDTFFAAAEHGNLDIMKWLKQVGCPRSSETFAAAIFHGSLDNMEWLKANGFSLDFSAFDAAVNCGHLEHLEWLRENGCPWDEHTFDRATETGDIDKMEWMRANGCPWSSNAYACAAGFEDIQTMEWLKEMGCPMDATIIPDTSLRSSFVDEPDDSRAVIEWMKNNDYHIEFIKNETN